jgi:hypothetical protein
MQLAEQQYTLESKRRVESKLVWVAIVPAVQKRVGHFILLLKLLAVD